jgi:hypothetical protein
MKRTGRQTNRKTNRGRMTARLITCAGGRFSVISRLRAMVATSQPTASTSSVLKEESFLRYARTTAEKIQKQDGKKTAYRKRPCGRREGNHSD